MKKRYATSSFRHQSGAAATEFAIVSVLFFALVIAVIEFARLMVIYVSAVEATRLGARVAAVCNISDAPKVMARMQGRLPLLQPSNILITYPYRTGCPSATNYYCCPVAQAGCEEEPVRVRIQNLTVQLSIPLVPLTFPVPDFVTSVPAESLDSTNNPVCT